MADLILTLPDIKFRHQLEFGSKAANLGLIARKMTTPPGFTLSSAAYFNTLNEAGVLPEIIRQTSQTALTEMHSIERLSETIEQSILSLTLPPQLEAAIQTAYLELLAGRKQVKVAVRSSATSEDLPFASFAGQMESYLNVESFPQVLEAIKKCWASLWTPRAIHYRDQKGINQAQVGMAVIIQEMVPAQVAGVMFTANPVTNSRDEFYIEAVPGLGEALVKGEKNADRYIVNKNGLYITVKDTVEGAPLLTDFQIKNLAVNGSKLEYLYQDYQDVEWAIYKGEIFILQTRPVTTLGDEEPPDFPEHQMTPIQRDVWTNVNERFPEPILPIDGVIAKVYYLSLFTAYQNLGFTVPPTDWSKVEEGLFPDLFVPPAIKANVFRVFNICKMMRLDVEKEWKINESIFDRYLNLLKYDKLKDFPLEIIMEYIEDALKDFQRSLIFRYLLYIQYGSYYNLFSKLLNVLYGNQGQIILEELVTGQPQLTSELNEKLEELALVAKDSPAVSAAILSIEASQLRSHLGQSSTGQDFLKHFDDFLESYGDREISQGLGGLAAPTWREKPEVVWGILKGTLLTDNPVAQSTTAKQGLAHNRLQEITSQGLAGRWPLKNIIIRLTRFARSYVAFRENSHFYLTQAMTVFRTLFLQLGDRLVKRGHLDDKNEIMYLTYWDIKDLLYRLYSYQKVSKMELTEKINDRKQQLARRQQRWTARKTLDAISDTTLQGTGASSGIVAGPVRIIGSPAEFQRLQPGDIMVAQYTNPAWTPVFSFIGGMVVEYGSTVSHAAIIAREYGLPAVMGVKGAASILREGEIITIDGLRGLIQRQ